MFVAFNFAFAQPLLDLLSRNAEFFVAREASRSEIVTLALVLYLAMPLLLALAVGGTRHFNASIGRGLHLVVLSTLVAALSVQLMKRLPGFKSAPGPLLIGLGLLAAVWLSLSFYRREWLRTGARVLAPAPIFFLVVFLFFSPVSKLVFPEKVGLGAGSSLARPPDVIMIIFDELPAATLMTEEGRIDRRLWPNFARLARMSTWFRNTTTVDASTTRAVPAILDGRYSKLGTLPVAGDHPVNLFTLLGRSHQVKAIEAITTLCPEQVCGRPATDPEDPPDDWSSLIADLRVIAGHLLLPEDLTEQLPSLDEQWGTFEQDVVSEITSPEGATDLGDGHGPADALSPFSRFERDLGSGTRAQLHYMHLLLPHRPWRFLPDGRHYPVLPVPGRTGRVWLHDDWLVTQRYQRHLLQMGLVDRLLGRVLDRLESDGSLDRSLVVVTADHGLSMQPGVSTRGVTPRSLGGIGTVPLFIKRPGQDEGAVDDSAAQTIDILPTVTDIVGVPTPATLDGRNLFDAGATPPSERRILDDRVTLRFGTDREAAMAAVQLKYRLFDGRPSLYRVGPAGTSALVGKRLPTVVGDPRGYSAVIDNDAEFGRVEPSGDSIPAMLSGRLEPVPSRPLLVAVSLNGRIAAVTRTYEDDPAGFYVIVPPRFFVEGDNEVELFIVESSANGSGFTLHPVVR